MSRCTLSAEKEALVWSAQQVLIDKLGAQQHLSALFLVGSFATDRSDAASDIDFLAVTTDRESRLTFSCETTHVEVTLGTHASFMKRMQSAASDNNNYILNLLMTARILVDRCGEGRSLLESAHNLCKSAPPAPGKTERTAAIEALELLRAVVKRVTFRGGESPEHALICRMRSDQLLVKSIYLIFWTDRKRTSAVPEMFRRLRDEYPDLAELTSVYARSSNLTIQGDLADKAACAALKTLSGL